MQDLSGLHESILTGNAARAVEEAQKALSEGASPFDLVSRGIGPAMGEVGRRFEAGEYFIPELLMAARCTKEVFRILRPMLAQTGARPSGRVLMGTVRGDLHDIGKNLVAAMLEGGGFEVTDLGVDIPAESFVAATRDRQAHIVGISALLTSTLPAMKDVVEAFQASGIRESVKIMVGGAPVTQEYANAIGADGYGENAAASVHLARRLLGG